MNPSGSILELKCRPVIPGITEGFGPTQQDFFRDFYVLWARQGPVSAYRMTSLYRQHGKIIAYKNVRKKIVQIKKLGLIESFERKAPTHLKRVPKGLDYAIIDIKDKRNVHKAKYYRPSPCGLLLLLSTEADIHPSEFALILEEAVTSPILEVLLWPYFQKETVQFMVRSELDGPIPLAHLFRGYLHDCLTWIYHFSAATIKNPSQSAYFEKFLAWNLDMTATSFVVNIYSRLYGKGPIEAEDLEPVRAIFNNDKKFMAVAKTARQGLEPSVYP